MGCGLQKGGDIKGLATRPVGGVLDKKMPLGYRQLGDSAYDQEQRWGERVGQDWAEDDMVHLIS